MEATTTVTPITTVIEFTRTLRHERMTGRSVSPRTIEAANRWALKRLEGYARRKGSGLIRTNPKAYVERDIAMRRTEVHVYAEFAFDEREGMEGMTTVLPPREFVWSS